jgi:hypothetical protein
VFTVLNEDRRSGKYFLSWEARFVLLSFYHWENAFLCWDMKDISMFLVWCRPLGAINTCTLMLCWYSDWGWFFLMECLTPPHLRMETDLVSEMLCSLGYWTMDKVQKSSNPEGVIMLTTLCVSEFWPSLL